MKSMVLRATMLISLCGFSSCTTTSSVLPLQLTVLDGYDARRATEPVRMLEAEGGEQFAYAPHTGVSFVKANGEKTPDAYFKAISVRDGILVGAFNQGPLYSVRLDSLKEVQITRPSTWKTVVFATVMTLGLVGLGAMGVAGLSNLHLNIHLF